MGTQLDYKLVLESFLFTNGDRLWPGLMVWTSCISLKIYCKLLRCRTKVLVNTWI